MARFSVLDGDGLDATLGRIQRQVVLFYPSRNERSRDLPEPWFGAVTLIGEGMSLEGWNGTTWVALGGGTVAGGGGGTGQTVIPGDVWVRGYVVSEKLVQTPRLWLNDPVGTDYPSLRFLEGDGAGPGFQSPNYLEVNYHTNKLHAYHSLAPSKELLRLGRPSAISAELGLQDWTFEDGGDGWLRLFYGTDRTTAEAAVYSDGRLTITGGLTASSAVLTSHVQAPYVQVPSGTLAVRAVDYVALEGNGPIGSPAARVYVGYAWGLGVAPTSTVYTTNAWSNAYNGRPFVIWKAGGSAGCGIGFSDEPAGIGQSIKVVNLHLGHGLSFVNWNDTAQSVIYCSQIYQASGRETKRDVVDLDDEVDALDVVRRLRPVRYRRLPKQLTTGELDPDDVPPKSAGLIAEEVAGVFPLAAGEGEHGPGLEWASITALLIRAVQRLADEVSTLSARVAQLEGGAV